MRRALVTGATGFIGRHLVRSLTSGGVQVHGVTRSGSHRAPVMPDGVTLHRLDRPSTQVAGVIGDVRPDVVFHLATHFAARHSPDEITDMVESNVTLGTVVAESASAVGARLVHATSAWQHADGAAYSPVSLYAATKQAFVEVVAYYREVRNLDAREVCLFDTYGPDDDRGKLVSTLLDHAASGTDLAMSSGRQLIDLTYVDDVVAAFRRVAEHPGPVERLVVRTGRPTSVRDLVDVVADVTGRTVHVRWGSRPDRPREMLTDWPVPSDDLGWRATVSLADGRAPKATRGVR